MQGPETPKSKIDPAWFQNALLDNIKALPGSCLAELLQKTSVILTPARELGGAGLHSVPGTRHSNRLHSFCFDFEIPVEVHRFEAPSEPEPAAFNFLRLLHPCRSSAS